MADRRGETFKGLLASSSWGVHRCVLAIVVALTAAVLPMIPPSVGAAPTMGNGDW